MGKTNENFERIEITITKDNTKDIIMEILFSIFSIYRNYLIFCRLVKTYFIKSFSSNKKIQFIIVAGEGKNNTTKEESDK